jgi:hypothetical protein
MSVGYSEVESQGFIFSVLDDSGRLYVNPVSHEDSLLPELQGATTIEQEKASAVLRSLAFLALDEQRPARRFSIEDRNHRFSFSSEFGGTSPTHPDEPGDDIAHFKKIARKLAEQHANPYLKIPRKG